jgi:L-seryl-tRNA(Ser) seleniumtransferase
LRLYRPPHDPWERIPVLQMIGASASAVGVRANAIVEQLAAHTGISAVVEPDVSYAGGGTLPLSELATRVIAISSPDTSASVAVARLRAGDMPVIARVDRDRVIFDLRTVLPAQEAGLVMAIRRAYS